jgi:hypothetical protein
MYHQFGWWHPWSSWMPMAFFRPVRTKFCLQQLVSAEGVNFSNKKHGNPMSRDGVSGVSWRVSGCLGVSRACLGVSRGVSACLGMVSRGVWRVSGWCRGQKNMILSYLIRHNKTDYRSGNNKKADYCSEKKNLSYSFIFHKKNGLPLREQKRADYRSENTKKSGLPLGKQKNITGKNLPL